MEKNKTTIRLAAWMSVVTFVMTITPQVRSSVSKPSLTANRQANLQADLQAKPWLLFLPGSGCGHYREDESRWIQEIGTLQPFQILVIEKRGVRADGSCDADEFHEHSVRETRIADITRVMASEIPANARILLVAESEGAYISPTIAEADRRVQALINLSGGTKSWIDEEVALVPQSQQASLRNYFDREVVGHFDFHRFYRGFSFAELNSYDNHKTYESLSRLQIPVLMLNGDRDDETWVDGTRSDITELLRLGKSNIEMTIFPGAAHSLDCDSDDRYCDPGALRSGQKKIIGDFLSKNF